MKRLVTVGRVYIHTYTSNLVNEKTEIINKIIRDRNIVPVILDIG